MSTSTSPQQLIDVIRERNRQFYSDRRGIGALKDLQQTFPNPWLYVAELLQNAIDAKAVRIIVEPMPDGSLVFEHDGTQFSEQDVESLCMRGVSSKGAGTVGFMGIGFKSVFRSFEQVQVTSAEWCFTLTVASRKGDRFGDNQRDWLGAVLPVWDESIVAPSSGMKCRFHLRHRLTGLPAASEDLDHVLGSDENLLALLAWQGVEELNWNGQKWILARVEEPVTDLGSQRVQLSSLDGQGETLHRWLLFSQSYQPSDKAIARFLEHRQLTPTPEDQPRVYEEASRCRRVAVFCEIDESGDPRPAERGSAFALLPTGVTFPLGLHVQADWLLVVSRRELMQIEGNEWHEEILGQVPALLRNFLAWLVATPWPNETQWHIGYNALPGEFSDEREADQWFKSDVFRQQLFDCLIDLPFLPVPSSHDASVSFISPRRGQQLPRHLAALFEDDGFSHRALFGDHAFSSALLGNRALRHLNDLGLLSQLSAKDLEQLWANEAISLWLDKVEESRRDAALAELLEALASLDTDEEWRYARLPCLPSEAGGWIFRDGAKRYPPDWAVLAQEDVIRGELEPFVGASAETIRWSFDRSLQQLRSPGSNYVTPIVATRLEDLAEHWWNSLPSRPTEDKANAAIRFTAWVRGKQPQRKSLVRKLLSRDSDNTSLFLPTPEVLLSAPYAEPCRRMWFPNMTTVAPDYLAVDADASAGDWRSFFESLVPAPNGRFDLCLTGASYSWQQLRELMGDGYSPPDRRSSPKSVTWRGLTLTSDEYRVLDADLPPPLKQRFASSTPITLEESRSIANWIAESPGRLKEHSSCKIAYIPYGLGTSCEYILARNASWKTTLQNTPWVFASNGAGPFCPDDVLDQIDPARPDAPVAELPTEFLRLLKDVGIRFGSRLPDAPAIIRLRVQGPTAPIADLLECVRNAIQEGGKDAAKQSLLIDTLRCTQVFPLPPGRESPDRQNRVPLDRVVGSERGRSNFGAWLSAADSFSEESLEGQLFNLVRTVVPFPETTTGRQALDFLAWVWQAKPDADRVRNLLPRAYQYVREDWESANLSNHLDGLRASIVVFTQNKRQWLPVTDDAVFLNDLQEGVQLPDDIEVSFATLGHLGDNRADQIAVAALLGLKLLSARFRVDTLLDRSVDTPDEWQHAFTAVQRGLLARLSATESDDSDERSAERKPLFTLARCEHIATIVYDNDQEIQRSPRNAAIDDGVIAVTGEPAEFADAVCKILFNEWGLRLRRDLVELIPKVAIQLSRIGDEQFWSPAHPPVDEDESGEESHGEDEEKTTDPVGESNGSSLGHENDSQDTQDTDSEESKPGGGSSSGASGTGAGSGNGHPKPNSERPSDGKSGRGHTASDREGIINSLRQKRDQIDKQLREATSTGVIPDETNNEDHSKRTFQSDQRFRDAVMEYESHHGRIPLAKSETEEGHDIDSFIREKKSLGRKLLRRIEVKGKGVPWTEDEIVELSDRQYTDASKVAIEEGVSLAEDFDYWLYVVEVDGNGNLNVLPIRNPAKRSAHYEFRAGTWRHLVELDEGSNPD